MQLARIECQRHEGVADRTLRRQENPSLIEHDVNRR